MFPSGRARLVTNNVSKWISHGSNYDRYCSRGSLGGERSQGTTRIDNFDIKSDEFRRCFL